MNKAPWQIQGIADKCANWEHDTRKSANRCGKCGADLCEICQTDEHFTSDGHDLSDPRYWGV